MRTAELEAEKWKRRALEEELRNVKGELERFRVNRGLSAWGYGLSTSDSVREAAKKEHERKELKKAAVEKAVLSLSKEPDTHSEF